MSPETGFRESKKVLVVEDDRLNLKLMREILRLGNYQMLEAENAEKGIQLARQEQPDLILMDIHLPGMNGLEAACLIKQAEATKHIPILALTAMTFSDDPAFGQIPAFDGVIAKPFVIRELLDQLSGYLDEGKDCQIGNR